MRGWGLVLQREVSPYAALDRICTGTNKNPMVLCSALLQCIIDIFPGWYRNPEGNNKAVSKGSNSSAGG